MKNWWNPLPKCSFQFFRMHIINMAKKLLPKKLVGRQKESWGKKIVFSSRSSFFISSWNGCEVMLKDSCAFICVESVKAHPSVPLITADEEIHGVPGSPVRFLLLSPLKPRFYSASPSEAELVSEMYYVSDAVSSSSCSQVQEDMSKSSPCLRPG